VIQEVEEEAVPVEEVAVVAVEEAKEAKGVAELEAEAEEIPYIHLHYHLHQVQVLHAEEDGKEDVS